MLPAAGVRSDAPEVTLASNALSGPVLPTPVAAVMGVGYFANMTLDFAPRFAGMPVEVPLALPSPYFHPTCTLPTPYPHPA